MSQFFVQNFGCRATLADAAAIESQLRASGYARSESPGSADVVVLNTCTVTAAADLDARRAVREIHERNPDARIIVAGCYAQRAPEEVAALDGVTWVVGNAHQAEISRLVEQSNPGAGSSTRQADGFFPLTQLTANISPSAENTARILTSDLRGAQPVPFAARDIEAVSSGRTRPTLKIQDGCDHHCAYCIIPSVRGRSRSMPPDAVVRAVHELADAGYREIVLSGINLGGYGQELTPRANLRELLARLLEETPVERLRLSSIEPVDVTRELITAFAESPRLAEHFHMPLQSGSDNILRAMRRWYRAEHYARRVEYLRAELPDAAIGADVIAGFPGETEDNHRATLDLITAMPLTYLHVFSFSLRPGTEAAEMGAQVPPHVIRRRASELRSLANEKRRAFRESQTGKLLRVLTLETRGDGWTAALSGNYLQVRAAGKWPPNAWLWTRANSNGSPSQVEEIEYAHAAS
jgi:threonylcarbamoyladenosine tRNA methylthiotransferase MtaB